MRRYVSPLRYPGGKADMAPYLRSILPVGVDTWVEPFAGGAGAGLTLLDADAVQSVHLVEKNPAIAAFWLELTDPGSTIIDRVSDTKPTFQTWLWAKDTLARNASRADLGYAAFIVNRCSRAGIVGLNVGPIGGKRQDGQWNVASRFDPDRLAKRIAACRNFGKRLHVIEGDGIDYIQSYPGAFLFVDPPYVQEGAKLYEHSFQHADHQRLYLALHHCRSPWVLTYGRHPLVESLYGAYPQQDVTLRYSAGHRRAVNELLICSHSMSSDGGKTVVAGINGA